MIYEPMTWCLVSIADGTIYKIFAITENQWRLNSGITKVEKLGEGDNVAYLVHGKSGSVYKVRPQNYGNAEGVQWFLKEHYGLYSEIETIESIEKAVQLIEENFTESGEVL